MIASPSQAKIRAQGANAIAAAKSDERHAALWAWSFVIVQIAFQLGLLSESLGSMRVLMRSGSFGLSILFFLIVPGRAIRHPAKPWMVGALAIVAVSILHPYTNTPSAGLAHFLLYVAIAAPLFWMTRLRLTEQAFRRIIIGLWLFHTASAGLGVLQMYFPGRFQPSVSTAVRNSGEMQDALKIELAGGEKVWRPMGLTDTPGGAASAGLYAVVFGLGIFLQYRAGLLRIVSLGSVAVGLFCLYMGQIRSLMLMAGICSIVVVGLLMRRGEARRYVELMFVFPIIAGLTFLWAAGIGGTSTTNRIVTLSSTKSYEDARLQFLIDTVNMIPEYPLGAGLSRWGMMRVYFGDENNFDSRPIWVEIQFTGWLLDGGIPLIVAYLGGVLITAAFNLRIALSNRRGQIPYWAILLFSLNIASIAIMFNYPLFIGQTGLEFWFLNAAFFVAVATTDRKARARRLAESQRRLRTSEQRLVGAT